MAGQGVLGRTGVAAGDAGVTDHAKLTLTGDEAKATWAELSALAAN